MNAEGIAEIPDYDGNLIIDLNLAEHMQSRIFWLGYYSQSIIQYFNSYIEQGMTVIDVGANIGFSRCTRDGARPTHAITVESTSRRR